MTNQEAKAAMEELAEFIELTQVFDASEYNPEELREFGEEGLRVGLRAQEALRVPYIKRKLGPAEVKRKRALLDVAISEAKQTILNGIER